jgi:two-component system response regulator PilR (NtrC family)
LTGARILVVDDEPGLREMLGVLLKRAAYRVETADGAATGIGKLRAESFDAVITDLALGDGSGLDVLAAARQADEATQVIVVTAYGSTESAVAAMRLGAYDFVTKPFRNHELLALLEKALEKRTIVGENRVLRAKVAEREGRTPIVGRSGAMDKILDLVRRVASAKTSVLVTGESGTGKELVARALHDQSERASAPFVVVNCGAIPENLLESELFGHEKGAFTGASARKKGLFEAAEGGTLFLDEIGELEPALQVKLLRALQERLIRPLGASKEIEVDVRVVAATNRELEKEVEAGRFRQDLFYRLNVIRIHMPPLHERPEDIPLLAEHFLAKHAAMHGKKLALSAEAMRWLVAQRYPGNVRELENVVERAALLARGPVVGLEDLPDAVSASSAASAGPVLPTLDEPFDLDAWLGGLERSVLVRALEKTGGAQKQAAKLLEMTFHSLRYRLKKHRLLSDGEADDEDPPET